MLVRFALVACALGLFAVTGCGPAKLDVAFTLNLDHGIPQGRELTAQSKPQKITVEFSSSAGEVSVYVFKGPDQAALDDPEKFKEKALATKKGTSETFSVDVPANTAVQVVFYALKKTDVSVKLSNRK